MNSVVSGAADIAVMRIKLYMAFTVKPGNVRRDVLKGKLGKMCGQNDLREILQSDHGHG